MVNDIVCATKESREILQQICGLPREKQKMEELLPLLRRAVCAKLMIEEQEEYNLRNLVVISIKTQDRKAGNLSDEVIRSQIKKYDCHQTSLVVQKKVLLLMYIERELGIHMSDEDATSVETLEDLAETAAVYLRKKGAV